MVMRSSSTVALVMIALAAASACSSTKAEDEPPAIPPPPPPVTLSFPSIPVAPGVENTQCVVLRMENTTPLHIGSIHNTLLEGSHHLIVYRVNDTEEQRTPFPCQPFTDTLDSTKGSPIMVTQKADDLLTLPKGVGYTIAAHQMIRLEMHYINPTSKERPISAESKFIPIRDEDFKDEAEFLFIGNPDISIPARSKATLGPTFFQLPSEFATAKFFAMTGHEHKHGTNVQVALTASKTDPGTMVYDVPNWSWSEPKTEVFETPLTVPEGGGFTFTCSWNNTSNERVGFGESANDEMCFFWAYYYPSQGAKVCLHTNRTGGEAGLDICCPDHPLCTVVNNELKKMQEKDQP